MTSIGAAPAASVRLYSAPGYQLWKLGELAKRRFDEAVGGLGLTGKQVRVMAFLDSGPQTQIELSRVSGLDRTTMVAVVDALEKGGFARRAADPADRRTRRVTLTDKGSEALVTSMSTMQNAQDSFVGALTVPERNCLFNALGVLYGVHRPQCEPAEPSDGGE